MKVASYRSDFDILSDPALRPGIEVRFWSKVVKDPDPDGCWLWIAALNRGGYGNFAIQTRRDIGEPRRMAVAHRISWMLINGPIADGQWVLHRCDNPPCVNPAHFFLGTNADNVADRVAKGRGKGFSQPGESNPAAKLRAPEVDAIRAAYAAGGTTTYALAKRYGVSQSAISLIVSKKNWAPLIDRQSLEAWWKRGLEGGTI